MFTLIHRMIFLELFRVFFLCWIGLTGMILIGGVIAEATQQGLGPGQILEIIPYLIPSTMPYTLPATTLFATCVVYGRLAADNEALAIKAAGINLIQIVLPGLVLGGLASAGTMALYCDVIPSTHWELRTHFANNLEEVLYATLRKEGSLKHPQIDFIIDVKKVEGKDLIDAIFKHRDQKNGGFDLIARGQKARIKVDMDSKLFKVTMWTGTARKADGEDFNFDEFSWDVDMKDFKPPVKSRPTDMTWPELGEFRRKISEEIDRLSHDVAAHEIALVNGHGGSHFHDHIRHRQFEIRHLKEQIANIVAEYQMRPALSLGCLCFVMVGCPIGIWFSRSDYLSSFITCFLPIVLIYYPLMLCGIKFAKAGMSAFNVWPADALMALGAMYLLRRLTRN